VDVMQVDTPYTGGGGQFSGLRKGYSLVSIRRQLDTQLYWSSLKICRLSDVTEKNNVSQLSNTPT